MSQRNDELVVEERAFDSELVGRQPSRGNGGESLTARTATTSCKAGGIGSGDWCMHLHDRDGRLRRLPRRRRGAS